MAKRVAGGGRGKTPGKPAETAALTLAERLTQLSAAAAQLAYHVEQPMADGLDAARAEVDGLLAALPGLLAAWDRERGVMTAAEAAEAAGLLASLKDGVQKHRERLSAVNTLKGKMRRD